MWDIFAYLEGFLNLLVLNKILVKNIFCWEFWGDKFFNENWIKKLKKKKNNKQKVNKNACRWKNQWRPKGTFHENSVNLHQVCWNQNLLRIFIQNLLKISESFHFTNAFIIFQKRSTFSFQIDLMTFHFHHQTVTD